MFGPPPHPHPHHLLGGKLNEKTLLEQFSFTIIVYM
jgi:hypothetical protein